MKTSCPSHSTMLDSQQQQQLARSTTTTTLLINEIDQPMPRSSCNHLLSSSCHLYDDEEMRLFRHQTSSQQTSGSSYAPSLMKREQNLDHNQEDSHQNHLQNQPANTQGLNYLIKHPDHDLEEQRSQLFGNESYTTNYHHQSAHNNAPKQWISQTNDQLMINDYHHNNAIIAHDQLHRQSITSSLSSMTTRTNDNNNDNLHANYDEQLDDSNEQDDNSNEQDDDCDDQGEHLNRIENPLKEPLVVYGLKKVKLTSKQLTEMTVKELNKRLSSCSQLVATKLKRCRRTLKNRGYAKSCRMKRIQAKSQLEQLNQDLTSENEQLRMLNKKLFDQLEYFKCNQPKLTRTRNLIDDSTNSIKEQQSQSLADPQHNLSSSLNNNSLGQTVFSNNKNNNHHIQLHSHNEHNSDTTHNIDHYHHKDNLASSTEQRHQCDIREDSLFQQITNSNNTNVSKDDLTDFHHQHDHRTNRRSRSTLQFYVSGSSSCSTSSYVTTANSSLASNINSSSYQLERSSVNNIESFLEDNEEDHNFDEPQSSSGWSIPINTNPNTHI